MYVCTYSCVCVCPYICIIYTTNAREERGSISNTSIFLFASKYFLVYTHTGITHIYVHVRTQAHTHTHPHTHTHTHTYIHTHT